ncbi:MAG TPA: helix-turn-helix transcriptional regulator [Paludibacteraceae bacterium]|nr:helix-turn-helix transcriptional regulator [Paludibacteraceae bacterium]MBP8966769.1 helix-turn-helix transcriptional regulator [Paludibacteraceae bacterium]HOF98315.1 helix-turn-helix transcriptional regulator [Paludibacteraceae bacterium]HPD59173.1 helix-turn-helix transcriptional regulator [Paludibacteraceae bacterium]HPL76003.1 helix-turn-helix transcriptional regulator [Paludibacteraceae bacterium]
MDLKDRIEKIMQNEAMNAVQFASEIGIQGSTLSHILNGRNKPSLEVMMKILKRFDYINSDWLIFGEGPMNRTERQSKTPTLFDSQDLSNTNTVNYTQKTEQKIESLQSHFQQKPEQKEIISESVNSKISEENKIAPVVVEKIIKRIIVYFNDNTFQEFTTT